MRPPTFPRRMQRWRRTLTKAVARFTSHRRQGWPAGLLLPALLSDLERDTAVHVHQLRVGHWGYSEQYLHRIGRRPIPTCQQYNSKACPAAGRALIHRAAQCSGGRAWLAPGSGQRATSTGILSSCGTVAWWRPLLSATYATRCPNNSNRKLNRNFEQRPVSKSIAHHYLWQCLRLKPLKSH